MTATVLVAFVVNVKSGEAAQRLLIDRLPRPGSDGYEAIDCWWIAEDLRLDRSDNDSAVFVPKGQQSKWNLKILGEDE